MEEEKQKMGFESLQTMESQRFVVSSIEQLRQEIAPIIKNTGQKQVVISSAVREVRLSKEEQQLFHNDAQSSQIQSYKKTLQSSYAVKLADIQREHQKEKDKTYQVHNIQIEWHKKQFKQCQKQLEKLRLEERKNLRQVSLQMRQNKSQTQLNELKTKMLAKVANLQKLLSDKDQEIVIINQTHQQKIKQIQDQFQQQRKQHKNQMIEAKNSINKQLSGFEQKDKEISILETKAKTDQKKIDEMDFKLKKLTQPESFLTERKRLLSEFVNQLANYPFQERNTSNHKVSKSFGVFGTKSCGKTSMINHCLGSSLSLQSGEGGQFIREVHEIQGKNGSIKIFESLGFSYDGTYLNFENIKHIVQMDRVFICFESSIQEILELISVVLAVKPVSSLVFVRTKFELSKNFLTQKNQQDLEILRKNIVDGANNIKKGLISEDDDEEDNGLKIYQYSSEKDMKYKGNLMVKKLLKNA